MFSEEVRQTVSIKKVQQGGDQILCMELQGVQVRDVKDLQTFKAEFTNSLAEVLRQAADVKKCFMSNHVPRNLETAIT